jgi:hypothetical protein
MVSCDVAAKPKAVAFRGTFFSSAALRFASRSSESTNAAKQDQDGG